MPYFNPRPTPFTHLWAFLSKALRESLCLMALERNVHFRVMSYQSFDQKRPRSKHTIVNIWLVYLLLRGLM